MRKIEPRSLSFVALVVAALILSPLPSVQPQVDASTCNTYHNSSVHSWNGEYYCGGYGGVCAECYSLSEGFSCADDDAGGHGCSVLNRDW